MRYERHLLPSPSPTSRPVPSTSTPSTTATPSPRSSTLRTRPGLRPGGKYAVVGGYRFSLCTCFMAGPK